MDKFLRKMWSLDKVREGKGIKRHREKIGVEVWRERGWMCKYAYETRGQKKEKENHEENR
jgi:hypothetical protein